MNPATAPPRRQPHTRQIARPLRRLIDARLDAGGHQDLDELMAGWEQLGCQWPDIIDRVKQLTGETVSKNTLKRWYPEHRLPMPGR